MMEKDEVSNIIKKIRTTYKYDAKYSNKERENDIEEFLCALEYCCDQSHGKIYALHRINRNMSRIRQNGGFVDAPDDGDTDLAPARIISKDIPVVMFIRQNGKKELNQFQELNKPENLKLINKMNNTNNSIKITSKNLLDIKNFFDELNQVITKITKKAKGRIRPQYLFYDSHSYCL